MHTSLAPSMNSVKTSFGLYLCIIFGKERFSKQTESICAIWLCFPSLSATVKQGRSGASLVVQWLRFSASSAGGMGSIPGQGTKIPYAIHSAAKKRKEERVSR